MEARRRSRSIALLVVNVDAVQKTVLREQQGLCSLSRGYTILVKVPLTLIAVVSLTHSSRIRTEASTFFRCVCVVRDKRVLASSCPSVRSFVCKSVPHVSARLPVDGFP